MKVYNLTSTQTLNISLLKAWDFFSSPKNLKEITPPHMGFKINYVSGGERMYPGQIIKYIVNVLPGVPVKWTTEITHVSEPNFFVDEQRFGPYAMWHHQHHFKEVPEGVMMTDIVNYAIPYGFIGRLANWLFVEKQVKKIFAHRHQVLENYFNHKTQTV
ncbi:SRPBCC family protein [Fulvivirga sediminis]|uniref:SRPBCC family protein n=1 Tax=Fulvivirga sediminis TaxID=2803949 RepID=A0A937F9G4_9BACT|nr:SRPBCC family protein [Fulvivirga sediminis]MBL3657457.1 SRPBCC family protein [Fulvivirga sediminis]